MKRLYRPKKAADYLDVNLDYFNKEIRPYLVEIPVGSKGIRFDVLDLDAWTDNYKERYGCPPKKEELCLNQKCQDSFSNVESGKLTKSLTDNAYAKALEKRNTRKQNDTQYNVSMKLTKTGT